MCLPCLSIKQKSITSFYACLNLAVDSSKGEEALFVFFTLLITVSTVSLLWTSRNVLTPEKRKISYDKLQFAGTTFSKQK